MIPTSLGRKFILLKPITLDRASEGFAQVRSLGGQKTLVLLPCWTGRSQHIRLHCLLLGTGLGLYPAPRSRGVHSEGRTSKALRTQESGGLKDLLFTEPYYN